MSWFARPKPPPPPVPPDSAPPVAASAPRGAAPRDRAAALRAARGDALVPLIFPGEAGLSEAMQALSGGDAVLHQLSEQLGDGQWPQARAAIGALEKVPRVAIAVAPTLAAFIVATWHTVPDNHGWYGLNEAGNLLAKLEAELRRQASAGLPAATRVHALLVGPVYEALLGLMAPPLRVAHRGLVPFFAGVPGADPRLRAALLRLAEAPIPEEDSGWHGYTRAEALRLLVSRFPPRAPELPTEPPESPESPVSPVSPASPASPASPVPTAGPDRLLATLRRDLQSLDVGRARVALDVAQLVPGALDALLPLLPPLVDAPSVMADPAGPALRERALRLLGQAAAAAARPALVPPLQDDVEDDEDDDSYVDLRETLPEPPAPPPHRAEVVARLLSLAQTAPELALRLAAMDGLVALLPDSAPAVRAAAELALEGPELELKLRAVALLVAVHQRG